VFSLDGFAACNDRIRQHIGHFEKVCKNISRLSEEANKTNSAVVIKVNTILMRENIGKFEEFCGFLSGLGVKEITFNQLGGYDRPEFFRDNRLLPEQVKEFSRQLPRIKEKFAKSGLLIHGSTEYLKRFSASAEDKCIPIDECNPGDWFWFVNENGFISPCSYTSYEYKLHINDIEAIDDIDNAAEIFRSMRLKNRSKWCDNCHCTQVYKKFE
jgi:sulfatase maturation enzyme AslB (radical SAM superfamily)